jgi:hypothetical protein
LPVIRYLDECGDDEQFKCDIKKAKVSSLNYLDDIPQEYDDPSRGTSANPSSSSSNIFSMLYE